MITQEFLHSEKSKSVLKQEDLDTTNFILSLYESDDIDISEATTFLKNYINVKSPMEELALKYIAHNFQYSKQAEDTIIYGLEFDYVYGSIAEHSVLGFYGLLKEFLPPYTDDWELKQVRTYSPLKNCCFEQDSWVSNKAGLTLNWSTGIRLLTEIIRSKFDQSLSSLNKRLYKKLDEKSLALFFDIEEFEATSGYEDYRDLKNILMQ